MTLDVEAKAIAPRPLLLGFIHELPRRGLLGNPASGVTSLGPGPIGVCNRGYRTAIGAFEVPKNVHKRAPRVSEAPTKGPSGRFVPP
jgi:hypothetical protein